MTGTIRDRIQEFRRVPARDLLDNDGNPRRHPQAQRGALRGVLEQVGIAAALVAYPSERNGGKLTLIDGHLRKQDYDRDWPTLILDVTDAEADLLLATHDPLAALAEYDGPKLQALLQEVRGKVPRSSACSRTWPTKPAPARRTSPPSCRRSGSRSSSSAGTRATSVRSTTGSLERG